MNDPPDTQPPEVPGSPRSQPPDRAGSPATQSPERAGSPDTQPPDNAGQPGLPASRSTSPDSDPGTGADGDTVLAGFDPDVRGLDPELLAVRDVPDDAELYGLDDPGPGDDSDDSDRGGWLAGLALDRAAAFTEGGPLEQLAPCGTLAGLSGHALDDGLAAMGDDALVGLVRVSRRLAAWQSGVELAAVAELDHRRLQQSGRPGWSRVSEHVAAELAAALVLTGRSADSLLALARDLARLPAVLAALLAGQIDRARAAVFAAELAALGDQAARAAAAALLPHAGSLTTGQLRNALRLLVHRLDPAAARRRMQKARDDTRVEAFQEGSGNLALAGRELDPADAITADRRITAIARALRDAGAGGTVDQLRAAVFTALLAGRDPDTLLPAPYPAAPGADEPDPAGTGGQAPASAPGPGPGSFAALGGSVHLTLPASTWLGLADLPGEAAALGPLDAWTSRHLAARLTAAGPTTRWCITLTRPDGTAAAHACARAGPGPPASPAARRTWLTRHTFTWLDPGPCSHHSQEPGYRPPRHLADLIRARNRTCTFPGCRRPATSCDLDHTTAYQPAAGPAPATSPRSAAATTRPNRHPGWHLTQPQPGTLTWTTPHGRSYIVTPSTYPV